MFLSFRFIQILSGYCNSYPYVYNGIPTSGYYNSTGIKQLKTYSEKISLINDKVDGIDFQPVAYDYNGLKDVGTHWANPYNYEMVAREIFCTKGSANTFKPDDYVTIPKTKLPGVDWHLNFIGTSNSLIVMWPPCSTEYSLYSNI